MADSRLWALTDHLCKGCGGRVLQCKHGNGPSPGGNPAFKCGDCGKEATGMGPAVICWCGFHHRGNHHMSAYVCQPFSVLKEVPELRSAFLACGSDPARGEVGIMLERDCVEIMKKHRAKSIDDLPDDYEVN